MHDPDWTNEFRRCYDKAVELYRSGNREPGSYFDAGEARFLTSIGCSAQEVYDFAEDWCAAGEPSFTTVLLITTVRHDYFLSVQNGRPPSRTSASSEFPARDAKVAGFAWLPRVIAKARAKLRGEIPPDLMYCCGGDRTFFKKVNVDPADFLRIVREARADDGKIVDYVQQQAAVTP